MTDADNDAALPWLKLPIHATQWLDAVEWDTASLWYALQMWSAKTGTEGHVPERRLEIATSRRLSGKRLRAALDELVAENQLIREDGGYRLAIWEQPPNGTWQDHTQRERWARDKRLKRDGELCKSIKARDRNLCRYCGRRVDWLNRNAESPYGGTYDHVDPDGENLLSNVVVACRECNCWKKKQRTLEHAEMALYRPGTTTAQIAAGATPMVDHRPRSTDPQPPAGSPPPGQPTASPRPAQPAEIVAPARDSGPGQPGAGRNTTEQTSTPQPRGAPRVPRPSSGEDPFP